MCIKNLVKCCFIHKFFVTLFPLCRPHKGMHTETKNVNVNNCANMKFGLFAPFL